MFLLSFRRELLIQLVHHTYKNHIFSERCKTIQFYTCPKDFRIHWILDLSCLNVTRVTDSFRDAFPTSSPFSRRRSSDKRDRPSSNQTMHYVTTCYIVTAWHHCAKTIARAMSQSQIHAFTLNVSELPSLSGNRCRTGYMLLRTCCCRLQSVCIHVWRSWLQRGEVGFSDQA